MNTSDLLDLIAVVIATAITAFLIVACWSLLGGLITYIIALLMGSPLRYTCGCSWSSLHT